jgi:hypothetical protein
MVELVEQYARVPHSREKLRVITELAARLDDSLLSTDKLINVTGSALDHSHPQERAVRISLHWARAEAWLRAARPLPALDEIGRAAAALRDLTGSERRQASRSLFDSYTKLLQGRAHLALGQLRAAVASLLAAEQAIARDTELAYLREDHDEVKRVRLQIRAMLARARVTASAFWTAKASTARAAATRDADFVIESAEMLELRARREREAYAESLRVRIGVAVADRDVARGLMLAERMAIDTQRRAAASEQASSSPRRSAALAGLSQRREQIARAERALARALSPEAEETERGGAVSQSLVPLGAGLLGHGSVSPGISSRYSSADLLAQYQAARRELKRFLVELRREQPEVAALMGGETIDLASVQRALVRDQAVLQYLLLDDRGYAFVLRDDRVVARDLPKAGSDRLRELIHAWRAQLQGRAACVPLLRAGRGARPVGSCVPSADQSELARRISIALISPVRDLLNSVERVAVVPSGVLHLLPFAALPWDDGKPLVTRFVLQQYPSLTMIAATARPIDQRAELLAFAVPTRVGWGDLPHVAAEVEEIGKHYPNARIHIGEAARTSQIRGRDLRGRALHFATHGKAGPPDRTLLVLADEDLLLADIWGLYLDGSPRVVLSACETGLGERLIGDEVVSLANGFLFAGANAVVASLWEVPDRETRDLMSRFYARLASGLDTAAALSSAQREMADEGQPSSAWAAFAVTGR